MGLTNSKSNNNTYNKASFDISTKKELFKYANGRRFHNDENSKYFLPNDDEEGNYSSPVSDLLDRGGAKVLDTDYPRVSFTGIDISPIYPSEIKPCNLTFRNANILEGLPFPDNHFDFVYMRFLLTAFTEDEWQNKVIQELCRVVKPGGYLEIMEGDMVLNPEGDCGKILMNAFRSTLLSKSINPRICSKLMSTLSTHQSLTNFVCEERLCPVGTWAGRVGEGICQDFCSTLYTLRCVLSDVLESEGIIGEKGEKFAYDDLVKGFVDECNEFKANFRH
ncbi:31728_t:CDS:2, partial [Racocetra persica]